MNEKYAEYCVRKNRGYAVIIWAPFEGEFGTFYEDIDSYYAGNSPHDSGAVVYHGGLDRNTLAKYARRRAREMLVEHGEPHGEIRYSGDLM